MRKSTIFLSYLSINFLIIISFYSYSLVRVSRDASHFQEMRAAVKLYELTDICLFTEASYTRHLTQTDWQTPFQDSPVSLEHFPSGSFLMPPERMQRNHGHLD